MRKEYDRHTEMAWQALSNFIHPLDCSNRYGEGYVAMNDNRTLEQIYNQEQDASGARIRPHYFSKSRLEMHLNGADTYCYRSRPFAAAKVGYGGWDSAHKKFDFAQKMGIDGKAQRFPEVCVMLLGIDIDAKQGEPDAPEVCRMLLDLFPGSYHEPSTSGTGIHLYLKVFYPHDLCRTKGATLRRIQQACVEMGSLLERMRLEQGFRAQVDKVW